MLDPTLRAAFVAIIAAGLKIAADRLGIPVDETVLTALAIAIIAWIFGNPAGTATAQAIHSARARARAR